MKVDLVVLLLKKIMNNKDSLWNRMKSYEVISDFRLLRKIPVILRIDGRAFHTFTRWFEKPFDQWLIDWLVESTISTCKEIQWFKLAYCQSDEISILLTDFETHDTQAFFDYRINKINSIVAAKFSNAFNVFFDRWGAMAEFDCRCFNLPIEDVPNYFLWRAKDWERNSLQMLARSEFSAKQLHGKKRADMHEMLFQKWINRANLHPQLKNWTYITKSMDLEFVEPTYENILSCVNKQLDA